MVFKKKKPLLAKNALWLDTNKIFFYWLMLGNTYEIQEKETYYMNRFGKVWDETNCFFSLSLLE